MQPFITGMYDLYLEDWLQVYNLTNFLILDGELLLTKPWLVLQSVEKFLDISPKFKQNSFIYNPSKKLFCISSTEHSAKCLAKGSTRTIENDGESSSKISPPTAKKLQKFYKEHNVRFEKISGESFSWLSKTEIVKQKFRN